MVTDNVGYVKLSDFGRISKEKMLQELKEGAKDNIRFEDSGLLGETKIYLICLSIKAK